MRALAIAGPRATKKQIEYFRNQRCELLVLDAPTGEEVLSALKARADAALIFGGDGTVNRHLAQLAKTNLPVMAVPVGSGNDLARAAGLGTMKLALAAWQKFLNGTARVASVDLGMIASATLAQPRYFSCCANVGLDADAARRTDRMPDWMKSRGGYFLSGLMALARYRPAEISYSAEEAARSERGWFLSVSNTPTFGGGLKIAPQAIINDQQLDVTFVSAKHFSRMGLARHFPKIFSGEHVGLDGVEVFTSSRIEVSTPMPQPVYADGEYITETPCRIETAAGALRLVTA